MADLLSEVQHQQQQHILNASAWRAWRSSSALASAGDSCGCPLLADEVYSTAAPSPSPAAEVGRVPAASQQATTPAWSNAGSSAGSCSSGGGGGSCNKSPAASGAAAALAGCRRQFLGAPSTSAAAVVPAMKRSYTLKSRPGGILGGGFGPGHVPGLLPRPQSSQEQAAVLNLPARPGVCAALACTRLQPRSCCPPSAPEPLREVDPQAASLIAQRQAQRMLEPQLLINRLVYDSLEPGPDQLACGAGAATPGSCAGSSSAGSSCRTTGSGFTSRSNSTVGEEACCGAATVPDAGCGQAQQLDAAAARHAYAAGLQPWYIPQSAADSTLVFESRFESGNLRRAVQVDDWEYDLVLQPDFNTKGHTQFFFFAVSNTRAGQPYRFNIINLQKDDSLYSLGMLPLMHSEQDMRREGVGWVRRGSEVGYGPNGIRRGKQGTYHTLTFVVEFPWDDDLVHLAHCYPLTFTDLQNQLHMLLKEPSGALMQRSTLATSLAGNAVDLLTITAPSGRGKPLSQRQGVVLSARVHPGETNSSWMMKGALQQLLASTTEAAQLREAFVFKVVPMLNPDGVIAGNYRCSLAGFDLNRVWQEPDARLQPTIAAYKAMIAGFANEREVVLMCDLHGHSRKYGIFMYGCERKPATSSGSASGVVPGSLGGLPGVPVRVQERLFPLMLAINAPDLFTYKGCNFKVQRSKAGTGRVVGFSEMGLVNSFTIEASFCGPVLSGSRFSRQHFNTGHLEDMGSALVRTLLDYWAPAELSSAAELALHLAGPLAGVLDLGGAGDGDDDACTDSDDESSDEEEPAPAAACAARQQGGLGRPGGGRAQGEAAGIAAAGVQDSAAAEAAAAAAAAAVAATARSTVAHLTGQLAAMLRTGVAAAGQVEGVASAARPAAVFAAAAAAADTGFGTGLGALLSSLTGSLASASGTPGSSNSKSSQGSAGSSSKSSLAATEPVAAAAKAAQELLTRLVAAKAKLPPAGTAATAAATAVAPPAAAAASAMAADDKLCSGGMLPAPAGTAARNISCAAGTGADVPAVACWPRAVGSAAEQGDAAAAASPVAAGGVAAAPGRATEAFPGTTDMPAGVGSDDAALAAMPGLIDILQQLVAQFAVLDGAAAAAAAAASGGASAKVPKTKGRRRGLARYGNPEVLRAARARADAGLAAALPELGRSLLGLDLAQLSPCDADDRGGGLSCSSSPLAAAESPPGSGLHIMSGRRAGALAFGPKAGAGCVLDACRYLELLDKQKQHTGGVLATSSIDDPWDAAAVQPAVAPAAPGRPQLADPHAGFEGSGGGGGSRRRSKSAHAWLQRSFRQRISNSDAEAVASR